MFLKHNCVEMSSNRTKDRVKHLNFNLKRKTDFFDSRMSSCFRNHVSYFHMPLRNSNGHENNICPKSFFLLLLLLQKKKMELFSFSTPKERNLPMLQSNCFFFGKSFAAKFFFLWQGSCFLEKDKINWKKY